MYRSTKAPSSARYFGPRANRGHTTIVLRAFDTMEAAELYIASRNGEVSR